MQKRAGLLFLAQSTSRILLILENRLWTVPTFTRQGTLLEDAEQLLTQYNRGKVLPIELYLSQDRGFEYGTYVCLVDNEFLVENINTFAWAMMNDLPSQLHNGLRSTLNNHTIKIKIDTILELSRHSS